MSTKEILFNTRFNILHSIYFFLRIISAIGDLDDLRVFVWDAGQPQLIPAMLNSFQAVCR